MLLPPSAPQIKRTPIVLPDKSKSSVQKVLRCPRLGELNTKIDEGSNTNDTLRWLQNFGYSYSASDINDYTIYRRKLAVIAIEEEYIRPIGSHPLMITQPPRERLKSEIEALDYLIQAGYESLKRFRGKPIEPSTMMAAIKLKNELTGGHHGYLTNYGVEHLQNIESKKYELIIQHLLKYIPEDLRETAISGISDLEENYYKNTEYYEDYLKAKGGLTEKQITERVMLWEKDRRIAAGYTSPHET